MLDSYGITNANQLGLLGPSAGQFRALAWWPSGNIRWVLVDFQADVAAGESANATLTTGSGNFGGSDLAIDGTVVSIDTGVAQFTIKKSGFNIFDSIVVGKQAIVTAGNAGRIQGIGTDDTVYTSSNDTPFVSIEENGPLRTVVKAVGALKSTGSSRLVDYTLRLHFFKGSSRVKGFVTLRNASSNFKTDIAFKSVEVVVPMSISGTKTALFSRASDTVSRTLLTGDIAYLYQGYGTGIPVTQTNDCYYWQPPMPVASCGATFTPDASYQGLLIQAGTEKVNSSGNSSEWSMGYADMRNENGVGVTVAHRWMPAFWSSGFEFKESGETSIELYSKRNGGRNIGMAFGKHDTHEVMWDFHAGTTNGILTLYSLQYPLIARTDLAYYIRAKALFGQQELVTEAEQNKFYSELTPNNRQGPSLANPAMTVFRSWQWSKPGGSNQIDFPLGQLFDFLRTGRGGFYLLGQQRTIWNMESAIGMSDDFSGFYQGDATVLHPFTATIPQLSRGWADTEHANFGSIPFYYFISGDESVKEGYIAAGERWQRANTAGYYPIPTTPFLRALCRQFRNMALAYEFSVQTGSPNTTWKSSVENALSAFLDYRDNPSLGFGTNGLPHGRNLERGYLWWETSDGPSPTEHIRYAHEFYHIQILPEAFYQVWRVMQDTNWNYSRTLDLEDFITGHAQWLLREYIQPVTRSGSGKYFYSSDVDYPWAFLKEYALDVTQPSTQTALRVHSAARAALWAYYRTGDTTLLEKGNALDWSITEEVPETPSELQSQALMWTYFNQSAIPVWQPLPMSVKDNGAGTYTISWMVPEGAQGYQIKYSDKQIVEWLGFDKITRQFGYDPASYTPFFAAKNINNNPAPGNVGTIQTITIDGMPLNLKFAAKCLSSTKIPLSPPGKVWLPN